MQTPQKSEKSFSTLSHKHSETQQTFLSEGLSEMYSDSRQAPVSTLSSALLTPVFGLCRAWPSARAVHHVFSSAPKTRAFSLACDYSAGTSSAAFSISFENFKRSTDASQKAAGFSVENQK